MAFIAKLFINGEERNVLNSNYVYHQLLDARGKPKTNVEGGQISFVVESTGSDSLFHLWMLDDYQVYDGYIRFYKRDGLTKLFDFEFANCYCVALKEHFSATGQDPLKMELTITPGIQRVRDVIFEKVWNPSNPFEEAPVVEEPAEPQILSCRYTDSEGNEVEELYEDKLILEIKTENCVGKMVDIDLSDDEYDFMYNGIHLENDILEDLLITSNLQKVELEIIEEED